MQPITYNPLFYIDYAAWNGNKNKLQKSQILYRKKMKVRCLWNKPAKQQRYGQTPTNSTITLMINLMSPALHDAKSEALWQISKDIMYAVQPPSIE